MSITSIEVIDQLNNNNTYNTIKKDSYSGIMFNVSNTYDQEALNEILAIWEQVENMHEYADGCMAGIINAIETIYLC
jgi:hypothetical protein